MNDVVHAQDNELGVYEVATDAGEPSAAVFDGPTRSLGASPQGVVVAELIALGNDGMTPFVLFPGQPRSGAIAARTSVDLFTRHVGSQLALMFENGDITKPIVVGVLRDHQRRGLVGDRLAEVEADGERLIVTAKEQLVLRCGCASITLTKEGKVLIQGSFVASRSSGVNRIVGGAVQIN